VDHFAEQAVFAQIGETGFDRLTAAFYRRVEHDELLGPMYRRAAAEEGEADLEGSRLRLREFLVQRFGGPPRYQQARGHPRLRMRHMPFRIDIAARDRWLRLMHESIDEAGLPDAPAAAMRNMFVQVADFLRNVEEGQPPSAPTVQISLDRPQRPG
jgi:hemoglobin